MQCNACERCLSNSMASDGETHRAILVFIIRMLLSRLRRRSPRLALAGSPLRCRGARLRPLLLLLRPCSTADACFLVHTELTDSGLRWAQRARAHQQNMQCYARPVSAYHSTADDAVDGRCEQLAQ